MLLNARYHVEFISFLDSQVPGHDVEVQLNLNSLKNQEESSEERIKRIVTSICAIADEIDAQYFVSSSILFKNIYPKLTLSN